jgi:soluble lytic murein transglycosylase-like protein
MDEPVGRESLTGLVRKPVIQLLLIVTAAAQIVNVEAKGVGGGGEEGATNAVPVLSLEPAKVTPDFSVGSAWLERAIARESERLGADYRQRGYSVTPQLALQIGRVAAEFEIEPDVAFGLVRAESSFRNQATSRVGAVGLTQLMPRTAAWMEPGVTRAQLRDPETNLRIGFKYLRYLLDKYDGDERLALIAYNRGPGTVDNALRRGRNPDNGYADFVYGNPNHGHRLFTRR